MAHYEQFHYNLTTYFTTAYCKHRTFASHYARARTTSATLYVTPPVRTAHTAPRTTPAARTYRTTYRPAHDRLAGVRDGSVVWYCGGTQPSSTATVSWCYSVSRRTAFLVRGCSLLRLIGCISRILTFAM